MERSVLRDKKTREPEHLVDHGLRHDDESELLCPEDVSGLRAIPRLHEVEMELVKPLPPNRIDANVGKLSIHPIHKPSIKVLWI